MRRPFAQSKPSRWSPFDWWRDPKRWWHDPDKRFMVAVSIIPGLAWGLVGVWIGGQVNLFRDRFGFGPLYAFGVVTGMGAGVAHASLSWFARKRLYEKMRWSYTRQALRYAFVAVGFGIFWGAMSGNLALLVIGLFNPTNFVGQIALFGSLTGTFVAVGVIYGLVVSIFTVIPAAFVMAPLTLLVWEKALERLPSNRVRFRLENDSVD